jgi:hypothetical protein
MARPPHPCRLLDSCAEDCCRDPGTTPGPARGLVDRGCQPHLPQGTDHPELLVGRAGDRWAARFACLPGRTLGLPPTLVRERDGHLGLGEERLRQQASRIGSRRRGASRWRGGGGGQPSGVRHCPWWGWSPGRSQGALRASSSHPVFGSVSTRGVVGWTVASRRSPWRPVRPVCASAWRRPASPGGRSAVTSDVSRRHGSACAGWRSVAMRRSSRVSPGRTRASRRSLAQASGSPKVGLAGAQARSPHPVGHASIASGVASRKGRGTCTGWTAVGRVGRRVPYAVSA